MSWLDFSIRYGGIVLLAMILAQAVYRRAQLRPPPPGRPSSAGDDDGEENSLRSEWRRCGKFVLQDDDDPRDHAAIDRWILKLLNTEPTSIDGDHIRDLVYHSLNLDIPFGATRNIREELLAIVRTRLAAGGCDAAAVTGHAASRRTTIGDCLTKRPS